MSSTRNPSSAVATGCLLLFSLPFAVTGSFLAFVALRRITGGAGLAEWGPVTAAAIAFGLPGFGLMIGARHAKKKLDAEAALRAAHPDSPWMWNPDWSTGMLRSQERGALPGSWVFAILWNSVSAPILFLLPAELNKGNRLALIGLVFPVVGAGLLLRAVRATARWRKFGVSELQLESWPAGVGAELRAEMRTRLETPPDEMRVTLTCIRRTDRAGDDGDSESVVWQDERVIASQEMRRDAAATVVPFAFAIPADVPPSDRESRPTTIRWQIEAKAAVAGVDYLSRFEVPVCRVVETSRGEATPGEAPDVRPAASSPARAAPSPAAGSNPARPLHAGSARRFDPSDATVQMSPSPGGGTEFHFGAGRNVGAALSTTVMFALFAGATFGVRALGAPAVFPIVIGPFAALLLLVTLDLWFGSSTVEITSTEIAVRSGLFGMGRTKRIDCGEVRDIVVQMGMTQQETATQSARVWYDIAIERSIGRRVIVGRRVASRAEAEWLAAAMREAAGPKRE